MNLTLILKEFATLLTSTQRLTTNLLAERYAELSGKALFAGWDMRSVSDALEAAVNKHVIPGLGDLEPARKLKQLLALQERMPSQRIRSQEQLLLQQFSTPWSLAMCMVEAANVRTTDLAIETSAGTGNIASLLRLKTGKVLTNEIADNRAALLAEVGFNPLRLDAEYLYDLMPRDIRPERIVMNPPFSANGGRTANTNETGQKHLSQALSLLADRGRLVCLLGEGMAEGKSKATPFWNRIKAKYNVRANLSIDGNVYRKFGTNFGTQLIVVDKTGATTETVLTTVCHTEWDVLAMLSRIA